MALPKRANIVSIIFYIVQSVGLWNEKKQCGKNLLQILCIVCYFGNFVLQSIALILNNDVIEVEFEIFSVISFCGMGILKLVSLHRNRSLWYSVLTKMTQLENQQMKISNHIVEYESDDESEDMKSLIKANYTKKYKQAASILLKIYIFTCAVFIISPFIEYGFGWIIGSNPEYPHIFPSWYPFDDMHVICYVVAVLSETIAAAYCVSVHIAFDATVIGMMTFICGQFSSLVHQCARIAGKGKMCTLSMKRDARAHSRIIACHKMHVQLVSCIVELDKLLNNILGFYFFLATLTLCTVALRLKTEQMGAMQLMSLLQYMCGTLIQLYIFCSYGDAIYNESTISAGQGPFGAAIWCLSPKVRREVCILGMGMMKQRRFHAGPFNTLDLPSFIQIVRTAYSYYAVLDGKKLKQNI